MSSFSSDWLWENVFELDVGLARLDLELHKAFFDWMSYRMERKSEETLKPWKRKTCQFSVIVTTDIVSGVFCSLDVHQRRLD